MPIPIAIRAVFDGFREIPRAATIIKTIPVFLLLYLVKWFFQGAANRSERNMHGKVVMVTGGTSGIGQEVVRGLASRGAQILLLTQVPLNDPFLADYIEDMRSSTDNELITAEQVDLTSLHSIRTFATKWIDNAPPRRLDMVVLCAGTQIPRGGKLQSTDEGIELTWEVNYLANFHLLSILSPAIRAQPPDRDIRIIMGTCVSYLAGEFPIEAEEMDEKSKGSSKRPKKTKSASQQSSKTFSPGAAYASSKLALMTFACAFQKHLSAYDRPDKAPMNARVLMVDPGFTRTPGMRRHLSWGSLFGLSLYLIMYPFWWFVLKSPDAGAQSFLSAAMEAEFGRGEGPYFIKECRQTKLGRYDLENEEIQKSLWQYSEEMVQEAEKRGALARAKAKKEAEPIKEEPVKPKEPATKQPTSRKGRKAG